MFSLSNHEATGKIALTGLKSLAGYKKVGWFIYMPGKSAQEAHWAFGKGKTADGELLKSFTAAAKEGAKKVYHGKLIQVKLEGETKRVFDPKGKSPAAAKVLMDAIFVSGKAGMAMLFPRLPNFIFYDPKLMAVEEVEEEEVDAANVEEADAAQEPEEEEEPLDAESSSAPIISKILKMYREAQSVYDAILEASAENPDEEILTQVDTIWQDFSALANKRALSLRDATSLANALESSTTFLQRLSNLSVVLVSKQSSTSNDPAAYINLLERTEPDYLKAIKSGGAVGPEIKQLIAEVKLAWENSAEQAESENYDGAMKIISELAKGKLAQLLTLRNAQPQTPPGSRLVEQRKFMLNRWNRIPGELSAELQNLIVQIDAKKADKSPQELADALELNLLELTGAIQDELDAAINAGDASLIKGLRGRIVGNPLLKHLVKSPLVDGSRFQRVLLSALDEVEQNLSN